MTTIEKIQKLLEITVERGATPEEAANALAKAQALLFKNNLTLEDIQVEEEGIVEEKVSVGTKGINYIQQLFAGSLAPHFACSLLVSVRGREKQFLFIGEKSKVSVFRDCFLFAYNAYKSCWNKEVKSLNCSTREKDLMRATYAEGFIRGLENELVKSENENALVIVKSPELQDYMSKRKTFGKVHCKVQSSNDESAYLRGYVSGSYAQRNKSKVLN